MGHIMKANKNFGMIHIDSIKDDERTPVKPRNRAERRKAERELKRVKKKIRKLVVRE